MSGLAGILQLDGAAAASIDAAPILARLSHRSSHGTFVLATGDVVLAYSSSVAEARSTSQHQPLRSRDGNLVVVFDGRLDNRDEVANACGVGDDGLSDARLVADAYAKWGLEAPQHLLGAFAFAIWDEREGQLFAVRDTGGSRPLAYRQDARCFAFASEPQALAEPPVRVNEGYIAEHLAGRTTTVRETLYEGIFRLPMGHALTVTRRGTLRTWRYWLPSCVPFNFKHERECIEHGAALLRTAVVANLRDAGKATIALSSGIDSCSIAATAASLPATDVQAMGLEAITVSFPGHPHDEAARASEAAGRLGIPWSAVAASEVSNDYFLEDAVRSRDLPVPPNATSSVGLHDRVRQRGGKVLLYGVGGDEWFFGSDGALSDLIAGGRWIAAMRWLAAARLGPDAPPSRRMLWWGLWGATPGPIKRGIRRALQRPGVPPLIARAFAERTSLRDRLRTVEPVDLPSRAATVMFADATAGDVVWRRELAERSCAWSGIEDRYPFADRRLIEFAFSIPDAMRYREGRPKWLFRQAFADRLPAWMLDPPPGSDFSWFTIKRLDALGGLETLLRSQPVARGWVDAAQIGNAYALMKAGRPTIAGVLWGIVAVDAWLAAIERAHPVAAPGPPMYDTRTHDQASATS